jgi:hypothetical protein
MSINAQFNGHEFMHNIMDMNSSSPEFANVVSTSSVPFELTLQSIQSTFLLHFQFAEFCFDYGKHNCRIADRPNSLFEGKTQYPII